MTPDDDGGGAVSDFNVSGGQLDPEEEKRLREQVRHRLDSQRGGIHNASSARKPERRPEQDSGSRAQEHLSERLRVIREAEDDYYAERGLYRYRNHRGEFEWLPKEERDKRVERRKRGKRRKSESKSFISKFPSTKVDSVLSSMLTGVVAIVIIGLGILLLTRSTGGVTGYVLDIRSEPAGAAIFVNGAAIGRTTNSEYHVEGPGTYTVRVAMPQHHSRPSVRTVTIAGKADRPIVLFTLYADNSESTDLNSTDTVSPR